MVEGALDPCPIYDDLESFDGTLYRDRVDLIVAGFPCQGASVAGKRQGVDDERWLWGEVWRIARETNAGWVFGENVPGLLSVNRGGAFEEILRDLASSGWAAEWDCVPAGSVGAPHLRDRLFLLAANPERLAVRLEPERDQRDRRRERAAERKSPKPRGRRSARASSDSAGGERPTDRRTNDDEGRPDASRGSAEASDAESIRRDEGLSLDARARGEGGADVAGGHQSAIARIIADGRSFWSWDRAPEPVIRGVDDGASDGMGIDDTAHADQLHLLGNGVVSQAAAVAYLGLWERLHGAARADSDAEG
jgi:site-specific DNA-cytosine methylase